MNELGNTALLVAFSVSLYGVAAPLVGARTGREELVQSGENAVVANFFLLSLATAALLYALLTRDFRNTYVASYTSRDLSFWYTVSALWAGQAGSLLFWTWLLSAFATISVRINREWLSDLMPYAMAVMMATSAFFLFLLSFASSPFELLPFRPADGQGLNPLLQNPGMFFHPPTLYLGYVGFTVPYAFAIAALVTGHLDERWIRATRRWTLFAWFFLTLGILFGMQWAYVELGWGGFWAWDPVENASLMPWLTGTAFLHSVMIQEKRGMLKVWNMVLIILTFALCIFGTFLTRSGVLSSVHSFALSSLGPLFFAFIAIVLLFSFWLLVMRLDALKSPHELDSLISRESSFLFNNLILVGAAFSVFLGTIFPLVSEAVRGVKISVGPPYFNQVNVPIGLALLLIMGLCPLLAWRKASLENLAKNFLGPGLFALAGGAVLALLGLRQPVALLAFTLGLFVTATILQEFHRGAKVRARQGRESYPLAVVRLILRNRRRYGGYIVHLGVILLFMGMAGSAFSVEKEAILKPGQTMQIKQYTLRYEGLSQYPTRSALVNAARLTVYNSGKPVGMLLPQKNVHRGHEGQPMTEVAIRSTWKEDLYVILAGFSEDGAASFKVIINPLMMWMWVGGVLLAIGTIIAFWPDRREGRRPGARYVVE